MININMRQSDQYTPYIFLNIHNVPGYYLCYLIKFKKYEAL